MLIPGYEPVIEPSLTVPRMGLVRSAVEVVDDSAAAEATGADGTRQPRWVGGFTFEPQSCAPVQAVPLFCDPGDYDPEDYTKVATDNPDLRPYAPYVVVGRDRCSAMDLDRDRVGRARQQLLATESWQIARELWRGDIARLGDGLPNGYLADPSAVDLGTEPAVHALAELETRLLSCLHGQRGMIHATPYTAEIWQSLGLLRTEQGILLTALDTIVVADAGYDGSAPGDDPGDAPVGPADITASANAYGTGMVYLRRGNVVEVGDRTSQIDRSINDWTTFVERPVAAFWDGCCLFTITVDHTTSGVDTTA